MLGPYFDQLEAQYSLLQLSLIMLGVSLVMLFALKRILPATDEMSQDRWQTYFRQNPRWKSVLYVAVHATCSGVRGFMRGIALSASVLVVVYYFHT